MCGPHSCIYPCHQMLTFPENIQVLSPVSLKHQSSANVYLMINKCLERKSKVKNHCQQFRAFVPGFKLQILYFRMPLPHQSPM
jgi:hypothetical protein